MGWSRRAWLASLPFWSLEAALDKGRQLPSEAKRYADPTTEFAVDRLTDPAHTSVLPACYSHFASHRGTHVLYASDRFGSMQAYRMDVKTGESRQLTEAVALDPASLNLSIDEHNIFYRDGRSIRLLNISNLRERELHQTPSGWEPTPGMSMSIDGVNLLIVESNGGKGRIMLVPVAAKTAGAPSVTTVIETDGVPTEAQPPAETCQRAL